MKVGDKVKIIDSAYNHTWNTEALGKFGTITKRLPYDWGSFPSMSTYYVTLDNGQKDVFPPVMLERVT